MKKKSFYFEDYSESDLTDNNNNSDTVKISLNRVTFLFFVFFSLLIIFSIKITYLSLYSDKNISSNKNDQIFIKKRGDIIDRNGVILARNIHIYYIHI